MTKTWFIERGSGGFEVTVQPIPFLTFTLRIEKVEEPGPGPNFVFDVPVIKDPVVLHFWLRIKAAFFNHDVEWNLTFK